MSFKILIIIIISVLGINISNATEISFLTHSVDGFVFIDANKELRGIKHSGRRAFEVELIREMMMAVQFTPRSYKIVPFKRGLKMIKDNEIPYAFFNTAKRPDRIGKMKFVGPLTQDVLYLYERKATPTGIRTIEDAKKMSVCVLRGSSHDAFVAKNGFLNIVRNNYEGCFKMLVEDRGVKFVSISHLDLQGVLKHARINPDLVQNSGVYLFKTEGSLSLSNQVSDIEVTKWQSALDGLKQSGRYDELLRLYLNLETDPSLKSFRKLNHRANHWHSG